MIQLYEDNKHGENHIDFDYETTIRKLPQNQLNNLIEEMKKVMATPRISSISDLVHKHAIGEVKKIYNVIFKSNHNICLTIMFRYHNFLDIFFYKNYTALDQDGDFSEKLPEWVKFFTNHKFYGRKSTTYFACVGDKTEGDISMPREFFSAIVASF